MESQAKDTVFSKNRTLRLGEKLLTPDHPLIMGILNLSNDSFYSPDLSDRQQNPEWFLPVVERLIPWCDLIDVGAVSTRPGSLAVDEDEEISRIRHAFPLLKKAFPDCFFSVDTYRGKVAEAAAEAGACLINDISGGTLDAGMLAAVARLQLPYVFSHIQGTPETMQVQPVYQDIIRDLLQYFARGLEKLADLGIHDVLIDPGFGFGKTVEHNYQILHHLDEFNILERPILVGLSRKSMIQKVLQTTPEESLNGTTILNTIALLKGVDILRVHDPKEARQAVILTEKLKSA